MRPGVLVLQIVLVLMWFSPMLVAFIVFPRMMKRKSDKGIAKASAALAFDQQLDVFTAMRVRAEGRTWLGRRWRQGSIRRDASGLLMFIPYRPRKAKKFDLSGVRLVGERRRTVLEAFWFKNKTALLAESPTLGTIEFGFGPGKWIDLGRSVLPGEHQQRQSVEHH